MSKPLDLADLDYAVEGPDRRFQDHGPGCRCGSLECPWFTGMQAARVYRELWTQEERLWSWAEACIALTGPPPTPF
jgi:hypothetical protein